MESDLTFGEWVRKRRDALGLTRVQLAHLIGYSTSALRKIESGERRPSRQMAEGLAAALQIPPEQVARFVGAGRGLDALDLPALDSDESSASESSCPLRVQNLHYLLTPLVGRATEIWTLVRLIDQPDCRVMTLFGPGGIGKTRLAIELACQVSPRFADGVCFYSLASLESPAYLIPGLADSLGFVFSGPAEAIRQLCEHLSTKELLLILDNFEQVPDAAEQMVELLCEVPGLKLLITSREVLHLPGEWVFEISGLQVPESATVERVAEYASVDLFLQCASRARVGFQPSAEDLGAIVRICQYVEGMPLGIELAAAWVRTLSCAEIADEISLNIDFLKGAARGSPERHHSIRAAIDHSWRRLMQEERDVIRRLSVIQSDFSRQAALEIAGAAVPHLASLVDKSLLRRSRSQRYAMHELIRQVAYTYLQQDPLEESRVRQRHASYYLSQLQEMKRAMQGAGQLDALTRFGLEIDNIRQSWDWASKNRRFDLLKEAAWSLWYPYELRSMFREGAALFRQAVEALDLKDDLADRDVQGVLLSLYAYFLIRLDRSEQALTLIDRSLQALAGTSDLPALAGALWTRGLACWLVGRYQEAYQSMCDSLQAYCQAGLSWNVAVGTVFQGIMAHELGEYDQAFRLLTQGLELARQLGDPRVISFTASFLCRTARVAGRYTEAGALLGESVQLTAETGDRFVKGLALEQLAYVVHSLGDTPDARLKFKECISLYREIGDNWSLSRALTLFGNFLSEAGDRQQAETCYREAYQIARCAQLTPNMLAAMTGISSVELAAGSLRRAYRMLAWVVNHPACDRETLEIARRQLERLQETDPGLGIDPLAVASEEDILMD